MKVREKRLLLTPYAVAVIVYGVVAVCLLSKAWADPLRTLAGGSDNAAFTWFLAWDWYAITHFQSPLTTDRIAYPYGANMMWNTSVLAAGVMMGPLTSWFGPAVTFLVVETIGFTLCGFATFLLSRHWRAGWLAALLSGLFFEISPFVFIQSYGAHVNLSVGAGLVALLVMLTSRLARGEGRWILSAVGLISCLVLEFFTSEELLADGAIVFAIGLLLAALVFRDIVRQRWREFAYGAVVAVVGFGIVVALPLWVQMTGPNQMLGRDIQGDFGGATRYSLDLANLVVPTFVQLVAPQPLLGVAARFVGAPSEQVGYVGLPLVATLCCVAVLWRKDRWLRWLLLTTMVVVVLALGPRLYVAGVPVAGPLPMRVVTKLPVLQNVIPVRLMLFTFLAAGLVLGRIVDSLCLVNAEGTWRHKVLGCGAVLLCFVTILPGSRVPAVRVAPPVYLLREVPQDAVVAIFPVPGPSFTIADYWSAASGIRFKMVGGYVVLPDPERPHGALFTPRSESQEYWNAIVESTRTGLPLQEALVQREADELHKWGVEYVVLARVNPSLGTTARREITRMLGRAPQYRQGVWVWKVGTTTAKHR